jgi:hypothetical protein
MLALTMPPKVTQISSSILSSSCCRSLLQAASEGTAKVSLNSRSLPTDIRGDPALPLPLAFATMYLARTVNTVATAQGRPALQPVQLPGHDTLTSGAAFA